MNPVAIRRALYGRLAGDTTLNALLGIPIAGFSKAIYYQQVPQEIAEADRFPFVVFSKQSGVPTYAMSGTPALEQDVWLVKAVDRNTTADRAEQISARLNDLLTDGSLSISGATAVWLRRQSDVDYPETSDGVRYAHSGSLYRLVFEPA